MSARSVRLALVVAVALGADIARYAIDAEAARHAVQHTGREAEARLLAAGFVPDDPTGPVWQRATLQPRFWAAAHAPGCRIATLPADDPIAAASLAGVLDLVPAPIALGVPVFTTPDCVRTLEVEPQ